MIALNELLKNREKFEKLYQLRGIDVDLSIFERLEEERKTVQLEAESARAKCNKLCGDTTNHLNSKDAKRAFLNEINFLDNKANQLKKKLDKMGKKIDKKLEGLANVPDSSYLTMGAENLICSGKGDINSILNYLKSISSLEKINAKADKYLKSLSLRVLHEAELSMCRVCLDKIIILTRDIDFDDTLDKLLNFMKQNSSSATIVSSNKLDFDAQKAYKFILNEAGDVIYINLIKEFTTRKYKIKYKNLSLDMTKFVNEIDIVFEKSPNKK